MRSVSEVERESGAMRIGRWWIGVAVVAAAGLVGGGAWARPTAEILDWGLMTGRRALTPPPGEGGTGMAPAVPMSHQRYVERTDAVEARLCRSFGVRLRIVPGAGEPEPGIVGVHVLHPTFTAPDGATSTEDDFASAVVFGQTHVGFTFDHPWEMQPGDWTFVVAAGGAIVATKRFHVALPPPGSPTSDCGGGTS